MKLSEAIRLGAMLRPQTKVGYFVNKGSCAIGAAAEAVEASGFDRVGSSWRVVRLVADRWPWLMRIDLRSYVACTLTQQSRHDQIAHLNDGHGWTRERIADWVATIETQETAEPVKAETVAVRV